VLLAALFCGLPFGAVGVAAAYAAFTYLLFIPAITYAGRPLGIGVIDVLKAVGPQVVVALGIAAAGFLLGHTVLVDTLPLVRLVVLSVLCGSIYVATMVYGFGMTRPLAIAASLIRRRGSDASRG
jgi:PST family polysaccharide transporter